MKKKTKILIAIIGVFLIFALIIFGINELSKYTTYNAKITEIEGKRIIIRDTDNIEYQLYTNNKANTTIKAVVVNPEKGLLVMGIENAGDLYDVTYKNKDNIKFKQGQEILIYFNGGMLETYPAQIINVEKIEILKEESDIKIPDDILRFCYSSRNNVTVSVSELTRIGIEIIIKDTNELQYEYSNTYKINKKVKNKDYTGVGYQIGENTGNSTAGFTRYRT